MTEQEARKTIALFERDSLTYRFVPTNNLIFTQARSLLAKYRSEGLRTLDSIPFATALTLTNRVKTFITSAVLLKSFFQAEGLQTEFPDQ